MIEAFMDGYIDRDRYGLLANENQYRRPPWKMFLWRVGWRIAHLVTSTPLRNSGKR